MATKNPFKYAQSERVKIVNNQKREIKSFYKEVSDELKRDIERMNRRSNSSPLYRKLYLNSLKNEVDKNILDIDKKTNYLVKSNMDLMVDKVIQNNNMFMRDLGFSNTYTNDRLFRQNVVNRIVTGKLYGGKWDLSSAIWGDSKLKQNEISRIVAKGIAEDKSTYEIAKQLERYVNPNAYKETIIPGTRKVVDYNAQRLARTMVSHAYEESFVSLTKYNPFIDAYRWVTSGGDRVCPLCIERASADEYGLGEGIYPKDSLPLDHPNGMCTFEVVISMSEEEIDQAITDWYLDQGDEEMNEALDEFVRYIK